MYVRIPMSMSNSEIWDPQVLASLPHSELLAGQDVLPRFSIRSALLRGFPFLGGGPGTSGVIGVSGWRKAPTSRWIPFPIVSYYV